MSKSEPTPFSCPSCEAEYKIVAIEVCDEQQGKISCLRCDALFPAGEGRVAFKYFLVKRPSGRKLK
jgi:transcription elongation factor Elf1